MSTDQLEDLKHFIDTRISQSEASFDEKLGSLRLDMSKGFVSVRKEMNDGFAGIADAIEEINNRMDRTDASVNQRLISLE